MTLRGKEDYIWPESQMFSFIIQFVCEVLLKYSWMYIHALGWCKKEVKSHLYLPLCTLGVRMGKKHHFEWLHHPAADWVPNSHRFLCRTQCPQHVPNRLWWKTPPLACPLPRAGLTSMPETRTVTVNIHSFCLLLLHWLSLLIDDIFFDSAQIVRGTVKLSIEVVFWEGWDRAPLPSSECCWFQMIISSKEWSGILKGIQGCFFPAGFCRRPGGVEDRPCELDGRAFQLPHLHHSQGPAYGTLITAMQVADRSTIRNFLLAPVCRKISPKTQEFCWKGEWHPTRSSLFFFNF